MKKYFFYILSVFFVLSFLISCGDGIYFESDTIAEKDKEALDTDEYTDEAEDLDISESDTEINDEDKKPECTEVQISNIIISGPSSYEGEISPEQGTSLEDIFYVQFYEPGSDSGRTELKSGTYNLGEGENTNYASCNECVLVYEDISESEAGRIYFQESGKIVVDEAKEKSLEAKGSLSVRLVEISMDENYNSTPVPNGRCLIVKETSFDTICHPDCEGKMCGDDGCGGICGEGCGPDSYCSEDQTECLDYSCEKVSLDEITADELSSPQYFSSYSPATGDPELEDIFTMLFFNTSAEPGSYDLSGGLNHNFSTCEQCLIIQEDMDSSEGSVMKYYFQQKGILKVTHVKENDDNIIKGESRGELSDVRLIEVEIDEMTGETTIVPGGECIELEDTSWDTVCIPDCEGRVCGTDGCGGSCGDGCGIDEQCNADGTECVEFECVEASLENLSVSRVYPDEGMYFYSGTYLPPTGDTDIEDELSLQFYATPSEGVEFNLEGTNYKDCTECIFIYEDMNETSQSYETAYFQQKGNLQINKLDPVSGNMEGIFRNLRLVEVTIKSDYTSVPVQPGRCVEFKGITNFSVD